MARMPGRTATDALVRWLEEYAAAATRDDELDRLTQEINDEIGSAVAAVAGDEALLSDLRASTRESLRAYLPALARERPAEVDVPQAARDLARSFAHRRLDLALLLKVYRAGQD